MNSRHAQPTNRSKRSGGQSYSVNNGNRLGRNDFFGRGVETHPQPPFEIHDLITPPPSPVSGRVGMMDRMGKPTLKTRLIDISNGTPTSMPFKSSSSSSTTSTSNKKMKSDWENYVPTDLLSPHYGSTSAGPPVMNVRAPFASTVFASTVPPGNHAGHSYTDTSSASRHREPGNHAGHSYTDTSSASRHREPGNRAGHSSTTPYAYEAMLSTTGSSTTQYKSMLSTADNTSNASCHRKKILRAAQDSIHQPSMPTLVMLMSTDAWKHGILHIMSPNGMRDAPDGLGRIDQGALDKKRFRILRDIIRNKEGKLVDTDLELNAPMQFRFLKILAEEYGITHVAFQEMIEQWGHCDPKSKHASKKRDATSCHVLLTCHGRHYFLVSTSPMIESLDKRYKFYGENGGCAAVKVEARNLRDCLLIPREGTKPFQAIHHTLLGGNIDDETCIPLHAGVPSSSAGIPLEDVRLLSGDTDIGGGWLSPQEYVKYQQGRNQVFQNGGKVATSVSLICNFHGTREEAAAAFEKAAAQVIQGYDGLLDALQDVPSQRSMCDLAIYKQMKEDGHITNLSFKKDDLWDDKRREEHKDLCVKEGRMTGAKLIAHTKLSVEGGASKPRLTGPELEAYCAMMAEEFAEKNALLFRVANGKLKQGPQWAVSFRYKGTQRLYTFSNGIETIESKRRFEDYLLKNYNSWDLTDDGKSALEEMRSNRAINDKRNDKRKATNAKKKAT